MWDLVEYIKFNSNKIYYNTEYLIQNSLILLINFIKTSDEHTIFLLHFFACAISGGCLNLYTSSIIGFNKWELSHFLIYYTMSFILGFIIGIFSTVLIILIKKSDNPVDWLISLQELRQEQIFSSMPLATDVTQIHQHNE